MAYFLVRDDCSLKSFTEKLSGKESIMFINCVFWSSEITIFFETLNRQPVSYTHLRAHET